MAKKKLAPPQWGRSTPPADMVAIYGDPGRSVGARAIFHPNGPTPVVEPLWGKRTRRREPERKLTWQDYIELLGDRQGCGESNLASNKPLLDWLNKVAMEKLLAMSEFNRLTGSSDDVVTLKDKLFVLEVSPQSSCGYLYIGAWQFWPVGCKYEQQKIDRKAKWSSKLPIPKIGENIHASFNGRWTGVVTNYFVEHGYQGVECDCSAHPVPAYFTKQGGDPKRVLFFGADLVEFGVLEAPCPTT